MPVDRVVVPENERYRSRKELEETDKSLMDLVLSIKERGLLQPITVDISMKLLAGERRLKAHKMLKLTEIPCVIRTDGEKVSKLRIEYDENVRRRDLAWPDRARLELKIYELEKAKDKTWTQRDQQRVFGTPQGNVSMNIQLAEAFETMPELADIEKYPTLDEAYKELKRYEIQERLNALEVKKAKELLEAPKWAEEHYIVGDAFNGMAKFIKTQPQSQGKAFQFAEVDPPYGVDLHKRKSRNSDNSSMEEYLEWEDFPKLFQTTAELVWKCLDAHAFAVFWYGMSRHQEVLDILRGVGWYVPDIPCIWYKGDVGQTASPDTSFGSCYEPFFVARKGQPRFARLGRGNVFAFPSLQKKTHPTEKPIWLLEEILGCFLTPGSRVLVPFLGSGVTLRAAYKLGHTGMGWDLSDQHKDGFLMTVQQDMENMRKAQEGAAIANPV